MRIDNLILNGFNFALIRNGTNNVCDKSYVKGGSKVLCGILSSYFFSPDTVPNTACFYAASALGVSFIEGLDKSCAQSLCKWVCASVAMSGSLYLSNPDLFNENPELSCIVVAPVYSLVSGTVCLAIEKIGEEIGSSAMEWLSAKTQRFTNCMFNRNETGPTMPI